MGRVVDDEYVSQIAAQTYTDMKIEVITGKEPDSEKNDGSTFMKISGTYPDIHGNNS